MERIFIKRFKKGSRKIITMLLATVMIVSTLGVVSVSSQAEGTGDSSENNYGLHNPRVAYNYRDTVIFGHYWQEDTNGDGGANKRDEKQPIVWQVLERYEDGSALVLSDKVLNAKPFNSDTSTNKWKECSLRKWLNGTDDGDFLKEAFSLSEQTAIKSISIESYPTGYNGVANDDYVTEDKIFLLEYSDMIKSSYWFNENSNYDNQAKTAKITAFANANSTLPVDGTKDWWVRSPGRDIYSAAAVRDTGYVIDYTIVSGVAGVRPALRIDLSSPYVTKGEDVKVSVKGSEWDTVSFGTYEGKKLNWRVLNVTKDDALLLSDKVITSKAYNDKYESITWENSTLRGWLNNEFIKDAFSDSEKAIINYTSVMNLDNPYLGTSGGNVTKDKLFLLSLNDIKQTAYGFPSQYYIYSNTRIVNNLDNKDVGWWLRSPGYSNCAVNLDYGGYVNTDGENVTYVHGVRPALHINLSSSSLWKKGEPVQAGDPTGGVEIPLKSDDRNDYTIEISDNPSDNPVNPSQGGSSDSSSGQQNNNGNTGKTDTPSNPSSPAQNGNGISKKAQNITGVKNITKAYSTKKFYIKAKTSGDGKITYTSSNKKVAKISANGKITLAGTGKTKITVKAAGTSKFKPAQKTIILTVKAGKQKITSKVKSKTMEYTKKPFNLGTKVLGKAKVTYKSSDPKVLKVDSKGKVTLTGIGKATITITTRKNKQYAAATKKITINVTAPKLRLNCKALPGKKVSLSWNSSPVYDGYYVEIAYDSQFRDTVRGGVGNFKKGRSEAVISGFKTAGTKCYVHIRPYCKVNGSERYYAWSNTETFTVIE